MVMPLWLALGLSLLLWSIGWFLLALRLGRMDIADVAWGLGFSGLGLVLLAYGAGGLLFWMVFLPVVTWGLRLSLHIGLRLRGKAEDFRYRQWRESWGRWFLLRAYLQVFLLQTVLLLVIAAPLLVAGTAGEADPGWTAWSGLLLWLAGFMVQVAADAQLARFRRLRSVPGAILRTGLWRYSRHPNYFGEILMWWGLWLMVLTLPWGGWAVIGPLTITWLLARVSGVPMLEQRYVGHPEWEAYKAVTPALVPWGWLRSFGHRE